MSAVDEEVKQKRARSRIAPALPLRVLESMRTHDRPREIVEFEDLTQSLPRRFGLTGVVESQIRRYEQALRRGTAVPAEEVVDLLRLVLRRPDAEAILRDAGRAVALDYFGATARPAGLLLRLLPRRTRAAASRRAAKRLLRRLVGPGKLVVSGRPPIVHITDAVTADLDSNGTACVLYTAALEELLSRYARDRRTVEHTLCQARGDDICEWTVLP